MPGHLGGADDVDIEQPTPLLGAKALDYPEQLHADVRHDEVYGAEPLLDRGRTGVHAGGIAHVDGQPECLDWMGCRDPRRFGDGAVVR